MRRASDRQLVNSIEVLKGSERLKGTVVFSLMKDEHFFIKAFFDHYRKLGVDQFLILDDGSCDGTLEFLLEQPDTTVLTSSFRYGEVYERRGIFPWKTESMRAGVRFKTLIPRVFLQDQWCVYADADEFLLLPSRFSGLPPYIDRLESWGLSHVMSSMVTFYPERLSDIAASIQRPLNFEDLVKISPFFDFKSLIAFTGGGGTRNRCLPVLSRLLEKHGISRESGKAQSERRKVKMGKSPSGSGAIKVSLFKPSRILYLKNSHETNIPARANMLNCVAHFKFTPDLFRRVCIAIETKAWANESKKYSELEALLKSMGGGDDSFLNDASVRYTGCAQLEACENIVFPGSD